MNGAMERIYDLIYRTKATDFHPSIEEPDWKLMHESSVFSVKEIKRLFGRYSRVCLDDGLISQARFMYMPEIASCPFASMAFNHEMEQARSEHLDFSHFVRILDKLSPKAGSMEKVEYMFDVLQVDFEGRDLLDKIELGLLLKGLVGRSMPAPVLEGITEHCWNNLNKENRHNQDLGYDDKKLHEGVNRAVLTSHLCSLDMQNFLTVQF